MLYIFIIINKKDILAGFFSLVCLLLNSRYKNAYIIKTQKGSVKFETLTDLNK